MAYSLRAYNNLSRTFHTTTSLLLFFCSPCLDFCTDSPSSLSSILLDLALVFSRNSPSLSAFFPFSFPLSLQPGARILLGLFRYFAMHSPSLVKDVTSHKVETDFDMLMCNSGCQICFSPTLMSVATPIRLRYMPYLPNQCLFPCRMPI